MTDQGLNLKADLPYAYDPGQPLPDLLEVWVDRYERYAAKCDRPNLSPKQREQAEWQAFEYVLTMTGLALYNAQLLEMTLITILIGRARLSGEADTEEATLELLAKLERKETCKGLINKLKEHVQIDDNGDELLKHAVDARNKLAHGFFDRHKTNMYNNAGRRLMVSQLIKSVHLFELAIELLEQPTTELFQIGGISHDERLALYAETLRQAREAGNENH